MSSLPFRIPAVYTAFFEVDGIARLEEKELCLEFRIKPVFARSISSKTREVRIALDELEDVAFKHRLCIGILNLRARRLSAFAGVPGCDGGELRLRCRRAYWHVAQELASRLSMKTVERQLRDMVVETDRTGQRLTQGATLPENQTAKRDSRAGVSE